MASKEEIILAKEKVKKEINNRIKENPDIGIYEFTKQELDILGIDTSEVKNMMDLGEKIKALPADKKRVLGKDLKEYKKEYDKAIKEVNNGIYSGIKGLPRKVLDVIIKGAGIGMSVAGVINTIAPGTFPTLMGYLAGAGTMDWLIKAGLLSAGMLTSPDFAKGVILYGGAVVGATVYTTGKLGIKAVKNIHNKIKSKKENDNMER